MKATDLIKLKSLPASVDLGLLVLRVWLGLSMLMIHGIGKFQNFGGTVAMFRDKMGIPAPLGVCAILAESVCSVLLVLGLATRPAAIFLAVTMGVAFAKVHKMMLAAGNPQSGELAFLYLGGFVVLFLAGGGRFSVDEKL